MRLVAVVASFVAGVAGTTLVALGACKERELDRKPERTPTERSATAKADAAPSGAACDSPNEHVCIGDDVALCQPNRTLGEVVQRCKDGCTRGACRATCAAQGVELVYVVDQASQLSSFDPRKLPRDPFRVVGTLTCDPTSSPFSMAVDRAGVAWVLYSSGQLFRVSILDAHCSPVEVARPPGAPRTFGMGFVTDGPKTETEKLYVASNDDGRTLARLDTTKEPVQWQTVGPIAANQTRNPELTGTSEAKLFGYFPEPRGFVQEIDRMTGKPLGARMLLNPIADVVNSYAFAHWAGTFYIFATAGAHSQVHTIDQQTGKYGIAMTASGHTIVGAGVSTCAPLLESVP